MSSVHLALVFKDFYAWTRTSCVGLNVAGYTTAQALRASGVDTSVFPVRNNVDLVKAIDHYNETHKEPLTHIVISAPWLSAHDLKSIIHNWPRTKFVILSHSNVGFLQADPDGVSRLCQYVHLAETHKNLTVGGNSHKFAEWLARAYSTQSVWLPNIYPLSEVSWHKPLGPDGTLHIGAFGAVRPEKNFMTAAGAALLIARSFNMDLVFHMSSGGEGDQGRTAPAIDQMFENVHGAKVVRHNWQPWDEFIKTVSGMDLLLQLSYTESFNMVTADGILKSIPSVVSPAITWAPASWKADSDNVLEAAAVGVRLLTDENSVADGFQALSEHNTIAIRHWKQWLGITEHRSWLRRLQQRFKMALQF